MAKVRGPILSMSATGQIGKSQVYGQWRGVPYARQYVVPGNPQTVAQTLTRDTFRFVDDLFKRMGPLAQAPWIASVIGRPLTARNRLMQANIPAMRGAPDRQDFIGSPGVGGGLAPTSIAAAPTAVNDEISVTIGASAAPTGWSLLRAVAVAFLDGLPTQVLSGFVAEAQNAAPVPGANNTVLITGASGVGLHVVSGWLVWTRTDGQIAYGPSLSTMATPL